MGLKENSFSNFGGLLMYKLFGILSTFLVVLSSAAFAQTSEPADVDGAPAPEDALLTQAELENLVAPVALYPDRYCQSKLA